MGVIKYGHVYIGKHKIGAAFLGYYEDDEFICQNTYLDRDDLEKQELLEVK